MSAQHNTTIAKFAKAELEGLGFRQQGRSRLWLADNHSWLNLVEFTPDRWTKGTSLVNAAHWLWAGTGFLAFHEMIPSRKHLEFETGEQFTAAMPAIVHEAARNARKLQEQFSSFDRTVEFLVERAQSSPDRMMTSWWGYQAGIATGLCGDFPTAHSFLSGITDERVIEHAKSLLPFVGEPERFTNQVEHLLTQQRSALCLPPLELPAFSG